MATINPRNRDLSTVSPNATRPARLTNPILPTTGDAALLAWMQSMQEWREVREGQRGNPFEKVLTGRDLVGMGVVTSTQIISPATKPAPTPPGVVISDGKGGTVVQDLHQFALNLAGTNLLAALNRKIDDATRYDQFPDRVKAVLLDELAPITGRITGEIRRVQEQSSNAQEAFAQEVTTIRASVARAAAGVREVRFASASENRATAGIVTTVTARLDNFAGGGATVETTMSAIASRTTGLEAQYTVKVTAGGAMAGFGLGATSPVGGTPSSAFLIQADKFAIVSGSYAGGLTNTPPAGSVLFGVDSDGAYVGGNLKVTGKALIGGSNASEGTTFALVANVGGASANGMIGYAGGAGSAYFGVWGNGGTSATGVYGKSIGGRGVHAKSTSGNALYVEGLMAIDNTTLVTSLNADFLDGLHAASFARDGTGAGFTLNGTQTPGTGVATFSGAAKPAGNTTNNWISVVIGGTTYYMPVWT